MLKSIKKSLSRISESFAGEDDDSRMPYDDLNDFFDRV